MIEGIIWAISAGLLLGLYALPKNIQKGLSMKIHEVSSSS